MYQLLRLEKITRISIMHKFWQKRSQSAQIFSPGRWTGNTLFFKGGPNAQGKQGNYKKKSCQTKHRENTRNLIFSSFYFLDSMMRDIVIFAVKYSYLSKVSFAYEIITNYGNWHRENFQLDRELTGWSLAHAQLYI